MTDERPPYVTQFCLHGSHDGVKVFNLKGTLLPNCRFRYLLDRGIEVICGCHCHDDMRAILMMMRERGKEMPAPAMPGLDGSRKSETEAIARALAEIRRPAFNETPSGRLSPGQLEQWVLDVLDLGITGFDLTVDYIVMEVTLAHPGYAPSAGAVLNVLRGWADKSYIKLEGRPVQVVERYEGLKHVRDRVRMFGSRPRLG